MKEDHVTRHVARKPHLVRDDDHRAPFFGERLHHLQHFADEFRIERRRRLVEQHHLRLHRERACDRDALLLTARQMRRIHALDALRQPDLAQILACARNGFVLADAQNGDRRLDHVVEHRHVRPKVEVLEHHRELRAHALQLLPVGHVQRAVAVAFGTDRLAADRDPPGARLLEEVDTAQKRTLARTARADDADHVAGLRLHRHALQYLVVAELLVQVFNGELVHTEFFLRMRQRRGDR
ncbi:hypothetical protein BDAG_04363 [Burkholderia dolosa AU0158]|nr:hypothetical protein BDAG_04363 [Burkholderia dolosa AU0158]